MYVCHTVFKRRSRVFTCFNNSKRGLSIFESIKELKENGYKEILASELALLKGCVPIDNS